MLSFIFSPLRYSYHCSASVDHNHHYNQISFHSHLHNNPRIDKKTKFHWLALVSWSFVSNKTWSEVLLRHDSMKALDARFVCTRIFIWDERKKNLINFINVIIDFHCEYLYNRSKFPVHHDWTIARWRTANEVSNKHICSVVDVSVRRLHAISSNRVHGSSSRSFSYQGSFIILHGGNSFCFSLVNLNTSKACTFCARCRIPPRVTFSINENDLSFLLDFTMKRL